MASAAVKVAVSVCWSPALRRVPPQRVDEGARDSGGGVQLYALSGVPSNVGRVCQEMSACLGDGVGERRAVGAVYAVVSWNVGVVVVMPTTVYVPAVTGAFGRSGQGCSGQFLNARVEVNDRAAEVVVTALPEFRCRVCTRHVPSRIWAARIDAPPDLTMGVAG